MNSDSTIPSQVSDSESQLVGEARPPGDGSDDVEHLVRLQEQVQQTRQEVLYMQQVATGPRVQPPAMIPSRAEGSLDPSTAARWAPPSAENLPPRPGFYNAQSSESWQWPAAAVGMATAHAAGATGTSSAPKGPYDPYFAQAVSTAAATAGPSPPAAALAGHHFNHPSFQSSASSMPMYNSGWPINGSPVTSASAAGVQYGDLLAASLSNAASLSAAHAISAAHAQLQAVANQVSGANGFTVLVVPTGQRTRMQPEAGLGPGATLFGFAEDGGRNMHRRQLDSEDRRASGAGGDMHWHDGHAYGYDTPAHGPRPARSGKPELKGVASVTEVSRRRRYDSSAAGSGDRSSTGYTSSSVNLRLTSSTSAQQHNSQGGRSQHHPQASTSANKRCYNCSEIGHISKLCPLACNFCHMPGHWSAECPANTLTQAGAFGVSTDHRGTESSHAMRNVAVSSTNANAVDGHAGARGISRSQAFARPGGDKTRSSRPTSLVGGNAQVDASASALPVARARGQTYRSSHAGCPSIQVAIPVSSPIASGVQRARPGRGLGGLTSKSSNSTPQSAASTVTVWQSQAASSGESDSPPMAIPLQPLSRRKAGKCCFNCGEPGHKSALCQAPCQYCNTVGHWSAECPDREVVEQSQTASCSACHDSDVSAATQAGSVSDASIGPDIKTRVTRNDDKSGPGFPPTSDSDEDHSRSDDGARSDSDGTRASTVATAAKDSAHAGDGAGDGNGDVGSGGDDFLRESVVTVTSAGQMPLDMSNMVTSPVPVCRIW